MFEEETTIQGRLLPSLPTPAGAPEGGPARLVVLAGEPVGRKFRLQQQAVMGRSQEVEIHLDDAQVSRRHARILRGGDGYTLEDLGSRNGTSVNGEPIRGAHRLRFGDRIQIGARTVLLFSHYDPAEEQIQQRQRLEAIGRLGTGLAHDFNNLLGAILSSMEYLDGLGPEARLGDEPVRECLDDIRSAGRRASELTQRLLGFARQRQAQHGRLSLAVLSDEVVKLARRTFDHSIRLDCAVEEGLEVVADRAELHQTLMNLCINARDAMPDGGALRIRGYRASKAELAASPLPDDVEHAMLTVADTGSGMDEDTLRHAFDPFFTTKNGEVGAGLGLAIAFEAVRSNGGHLSVDSTLGEGSVFRILLPLSTGDTTSALRSTDTDKREQPRPGAARILLVDDEEVVRRSAGRLLRQTGHEVFFAGDGREAVARYRELSPKPDLLLMDLDMPVMDGESAYRQLRAIDPGVRVIFLSGYWDEPREDALLEQGARGFIRKPYQRDTLQQAINRALGSVPPATRGPES